MKLPAAARHHKVWFAAFVVWFVVLWFLSDAPPLPDPPGPKIPHLDKILHFGYYLGGAGILSGALYLLRRNPPLGWDLIHLVAIFTVTTTGAFDEWHQSWHPYRSGNNSADLAADFFGALAGTLLFRRLRHLVT